MQAGEQFERNKVEVLSGSTYRIETPCGTMYVTVNTFEGRIIEVFARLGKAGGCPSCQINAQARLISIALQEGINIGRLIKQLVGNLCEKSGILTPNSALSCPDAIGKILKKEAEKLGINLD